MECMLYKHRGQEGAGYTICDSKTNNEVRIKDS